MRRHWKIVLAAVLAGAAGYFLGSRSETDVALSEKVAACEAKLLTEQHATESMARRLDRAETDFQKACDERVDQTLADRKR
jgi:hypothetical protein